MVPFPQRMAVSHPAQIKTDPEEHVATDCISQKRTWVVRAIWHFRTMISLDELGLVMPRGLPGTSCRSWRRSRMATLVVGTQAACLPPLQHPLMLETGGSMWLEPWWVNTCTVPYLSSKPAQSPELMWIQHKWQSPQICVLAQFWWFSLTSCHENSTVLASGRDLLTRSLSGKGPASRPRTALLACGHCMDILGRCSLGLFSDSRVKFPPLIAPSLHLSFKLFL